MSANQKQTNHGLLVGLLLVLSLSYMAYVLSEPLASLKPNIAFTFSKPAQTVSLVWPSFGESAISAVGYNLLATHGAQTALPTASVAKIVTALAVLKRDPLSLNQSGPTITLTQTDVDSYNKYVAENGSVVRVAVGEQISEYQALQAMLLPSANNIAETLARWAFGSIAAYNSYANTYVNQLGMADTTITDPSGFLPSTVSTPHDLVILGKAALANPVIAQIISQTSATIPIQGGITNVNVLLGNEGIVGIKTGDINQDLGCFLFAANQAVGSQTIKIIGVIMNGPNLATSMWDALPLIASTAKVFANTDVINAGTVVVTYNTPWGIHATAAVNKNLSTVAWNGSETTASISSENMQAPLQIGTQVGELSVKNSDTNAVSGVPIILQKTINGPSLWWRLTHGL